MKLHFDTYEDYLDRELGGSEARNATTTIGIPIITQNIMEQPVL